MHRFTPYEQAKAKHQSGSDYQTICAHETNTKRNENTMLKPMIIASVDMELI